MSFSFLWIFSLKVYAFWVASSLCDMPGNLSAAVSQGDITAVCLGTLVECSPVSAVSLFKSMQILGGSNSIFVHVATRFLPNVQVQKCTKYVFSCLEVPWIDLLAVANLQ